MQLHTLACNLGLSIFSATWPLHTKLHLTCRINFLLYIYLPIVLQAKNVLQVNSKISMLSYSLNIFLVHNSFISTF